MDESSARSVVLVLRHGRVTLDVVPGGPREWTVRAGLADVDVVGTRFSVDRSEGAVTVEVERGVVLVRGEAVPSGSRQLVRGQSLVVRPEPAALEEAPAPRRTAPPDAAPSPAAAAPAEPPARPRPWQELAQRRRYDEAFAVLGPDGVSREAGRFDRVEDLLALADVARLSGHPRDAVTPLERIVGSYPGDGRAAVAAFTLGRVYLDALGDGPRAARSFERCIELGLPASLREDALVRLVEARARAGDREGARAAAAEYLSTYPEGRLGERVRSWAGVDEP